MRKKVLKVDGISQGHMLPLNSKNDPNKPETAGFASGTYEDGSTLFPGVGYYGAGYDAVDVSRIQTTNYRNGSGAYVSWLKKYWFTSINVKYLIPHANLKWVATNTANARYVTGAIRNFFRFGDYATYDFYARINYTYGGKVYHNIGYFWRQELCYWNPNDLREKCSSNEDFEILVCAP